MARAGPTPSIQAGPQNPAQTAPPNISLIPNAQQHPPPRQQKRRTHALAVIDPVTGKTYLFIISTEHCFFFFEGQDRLNEVYEDNSHPASGESSARQTPQPPPQPNTSKEVQATFAKQVAQAICGDESETIEHHHHPPMVEQIEQHPVYQHNSPQAVNNSYESIVQFSKLQVRLIDALRDCRFD